MNPMSTRRHRIAHALGWYTGRVETFWALFRHGDDKRLMVGFRCDHCGDIDHVHEAPRWMWGGNPTTPPPLTPAEVDSLRHDVRTPSAERIEAMRNRRQP